MHDIAEGPHRAGHDRDLLHGLRIFLQCRNQRMTYFMIGYDLTLLCAHDPVFFLLADQYLLDRFKQILLADILPAFFDCIDRSLIDHIGKVRTDCTARRERNCIEINRFVHLDVFGVHLEDLHASLQIGLIYNNPTVESSRTQQCLIQNLRTVGRPQNQNSLRSIKTIHLGKQLIQRLLTLFISAAVFGISASADRINLIDKDDTGRIFRRFFKQVAHTRCADTDVQLDKIGTGQRKERNLRLSGYCLCQKRLTGTGRAD